MSEIIHVDQFNSTQLSAEQLRIADLDSYQILDTLPEKELDELTQIASAICDTPISLISLVDEHRQWFKSKRGLDFDSTPRRDAFCQHALDRTDEVLVIDNPLDDDRFKNNPLVLGNPNIRFYAGAPLKTPAGNVLGTLCIIDNKVREISESQKDALLLLAKKAMEFLNARKQILEQDKLIRDSAAKLLNLTDQAPGALFQLEYSPDGNLTFPFLSKGFAAIHPGLPVEFLKADARLAFSVIHPEDVDRVRASLFKSIENLEHWDVEYRVKNEQNGYSWHWANAKLEKLSDGTIVWYGSFQNIDARKNYIRSLENIIADISHVIRKPVASLLGVTDLMKGMQNDSKSLLEFSGYIEALTLDLDTSIKSLSDDYYKEKSAFLDLGVRGKQVEESN